MKIKIYILVVICLLLTGCASNLKTQQYKQLTETTSYNYTQNNDDSKENKYIESILNDSIRPKEPPYYKDAYDSDKKAYDSALNGIDKNKYCAKLKNTRNGILFEQMRLIDSAYYDYESDTRKWVDGKKLFADITSIGISSAATIVGGVGVKSILALVDTGLKGASSAYDGDYLQGKAIDMIINQMRALRSKAAARIMEGMTTCDYSIEQGIFDLGNYLRAGYLDSALVYLATSASKAADSEEEMLKKASQCLNNKDKCEPPTTPQTSAAKPTEPSKK